MLYLKVSLITVLFPKVRKMIAALSYYVQLKIVNFYPDWPSFRVGTGFAMTWKVRYGSGLIIPDPQQGKYLHQEWRGPKEKRTLRSQLSQSQPVKSI
jgi:hypothetical protein